MVGAALGIAGAAGVDRLAQRLATRQHRPPRRAGQALTRAQSCAEAGGVDAAATSGSETAAEGRMRPVGRALSRPPRSARPPAPSDRRAGAHQVDQRPSARTAATALGLRRAQVRPEHGMQAERLCTACRGARPATRDRRAVDRHRRRLRMPRGSLSATSHPRPARTVRRDPFVRHACGCRDVPGCVPVGAVRVQSLRHSR